MSAPAVHPVCGTPLPVWPPFGPIVSIRDDDAAKLVEFYRGELDELKCSGCGRPLSPPPSLAKKTVTRKPDGTFTRTQHEKLEPFHPIISAISRVLGRAAKSAGDEES